MASGDKAEVAAQTVWAMRNDKVFVAFQVEDAKNIAVSFEEQKITFSCTNTTEQIMPTIDGKKEIAKETKRFRNEIDLFGKVNTEKCGYQVFGRCIKCLLPRAEVGDYWPRLTKEKLKIHWLKVDFSRWIVSS